MAYKIKVKKEIKEINRELEVISKKLDKLDRYVTNIVDSPKAKAKRMRRFRKNPKIDYRTNLGDINMEQ